MVVVKLSKRKLGKLMNLIRKRLSNKLIIQYHLLEDSSSRSVLALNYWFRWVRCDNLLKWETSITTNVSNIITIIWLYARPSICFHCREKNTGARNSPARAQPSSIQREVDIRYTSAISNPNREDILYSHLTWQTKPCPFLLRRISLQSTYRPSSLSNSECMALMDTGKTVNYTGLFGWLLWEGLTS